MTMPILPGTDGVQRMSKSLANYVGVAEAPEEIFGKVMRVPDTAMPEYDRLLLAGDKDEAGEGSLAGMAPNEAKRALAGSLVERFCGAEAARAAEEHFNRLFVRHEAPEDVEEVTVPAGGEVHLPAFLADNFDISRSEARRLIGQGGVKIGGEAHPGDELDVDSARLDGKVVQVGKRRHRRVRVG